MSTVITKEKIGSGKTKERIMQTAFRLFLRRGFTDVSINDIIGKLGLSKGGFFHHFKSKDHLLREIIRSYIIPSVELFARRIVNAEGSLYEKLKSFLELVPNADREIQEIMNDRSITYRSLYLLMMEGVKKFGFFRNEYTRIFKRIHALIREQLAEAQKREEISPDLDLDAASYSILVAYEGSLHIWVIQPDMNLKRLNRQLFDIVWNSITGG